MLDQQLQSITVMAGLVLDKPGHDVRGVAVNHLNGPEHWWFGLVQKIHPGSALIVFPAKAGIHISRGHRPSPV